MLSIKKVLFLLIVSVFLFGCSKQKKNLKVDQIPNGFYGEEWGEPLDDFYLNTGIKKVKGHGDPNKEIGDFDLDDSFNDPSDDSPTERAYWSDQTGGQFLKGLIIGFKIFKQYDYYAKDTNGAALTDLLMRGDLNELYDLPSRFRGIFFNGNSAGAVYVFYDQSLFAGIDTIDKENFQAVLDLMSKSYQKLGDLYIPNYGTDNFMFFADADGNTRESFQTFESSGQYFRNEYGTDIYVVKTTEFLPKNTKVESYNLIFVSDDWLKYVKSDYKNAIQYRLALIQKKYDSNKLKNFFLILNKL